MDITGIWERAAGDRTLIADDGLHPSGSMYRQWAQKIAVEAQRAFKD